MGAETVLNKMGITLPQPVPPIGQYVPLKQVGNLLFISGQAAITNGELKYKGKLGVSLSVEEGYEAARTAAINILAILKSYLGSLDRVKSVVKINGYVACADNFFSHPQVINGASDLFARVFAPNGVHARSAVGQNSLPQNTPVEVEGIFEIYDH